MYASTNFKTKKAFKDAVKNGVEVTLWSPGLGLGKPHDGKAGVEGPHYPAAHTWYSVVEMRDDGTVALVIS